MYQSAVMPQYLDFPINDILGAMQAPYKRFEIPLIDNNTSIRKVQESPKITMTKSEFIISILGSVLCLGKTLSRELGFSRISLIFFIMTKVFFWTLIILDIFKGIKKTCSKETRAAGIWKLVINSIVAMLMLK